MQETKEMRVKSLGQEDPLEEEMATHSNVLAWRISMTEEPHNWNDLGQAKNEWLSHKPRY